MTRAALYLRVSSADQNLENQLPDLQAAAKSRELEVVTVYQEKVSASNPNSRQFELEACLLDAEAHKFDVLLCWSLDRLSRRGVVETLTLLDRFRLCGVKVIAIKDAWTEFPNEFTPVIASISAWAAAFESRRRRERINTGLARVKATGKTKSGRPLGRPVGKKDNPAHPRKRSRYVRRWEREREKKELNNHMVTAELQAASVGITTK